MEDGYGYKTNDINTTDINGTDIHRTFMNGMNTNRTD
jgi:hypothetical protein